MGAADILWMALILAGCCWLLWHFLWKKQGSCHGCDHGTTGNRKHSRSSTTQDNGSI